MDLDLIALLGGCLLLAALLYYVIFVRREEPIGSWGKSGLVSLVFVLVPVLLIALWYQSGAENRLKEIGFTPYPGFISSSGVAAGQGKNPIWVFSVEGDLAAVLEFYRRPENHNGWTLVSENEGLLLFRHEKRLVSISANMKSVAFLLSHVE